MVTISVMGVALALAAPNFSQLIANYRLRAAAESMLNGLNLARAEAVRRNTNVSFALNGAASDWTVATAGGTVIQSRVDSETGGLSATSSNSATSITFLPTGLVYTTGGWLTRVTVSSSVTGTGTRQINVLGGGLIRMCDPAVSVINDPRRC